MTDPTDALAEQFLAVSRRVRRETMSRIRPLGLNPHQSRALKVIGDHGPLRPSELAEHLGIAARSASEAIAALTEAGWIERRADPADGRAYRVWLTPSGHKLLASVRSIRASVGREVFGVLDPDSRIALQAILQHLRTPPG
jgi:DNA-binding MarR family transcriptional regulator